VSQHMTSLPDAVMQCGQMGGWLYDISYVNLTLAFSAVFEED